eukprot:1226554-Lingulodinium_polyedra.AAC.1
MGVVSSCRADRVVRVVVWRKRPVRGRVNIVNARVSARRGNPADTLRQHRVRGQFVTKDVVYVRGRA